MRLRMFRSTGCSHDHAADNLQRHPSPAVTLYQMHRNVDGTLTPSTRDTATVHQIHNVGLGTVIGKLFRKLLKVMPMNAAAMISHQARTSEGETARANTDQRAATLIDLSKVACDSLVDSGMAAQKAADYNGVIELGRIPNKPPRYNLDSATRTYGGAIRSQDGPAAV